MTDERHWNAGEDHPMHVLTEDEVAEMRILRQRGVTFYMLGYEYGVSLSTARLAVRGDTAPGGTWACVERPAPVSRTQEFDR